MTTPTEPTSSVHYAIRLPSGKLAHDIPGDLRVGGADYRTLPGDRKAYLWPENNKGGASATVKNIARTMKCYDAQELFEQHTRVVRVVITAEIIDGGPE